MEPEVSVAGALMLEYQELKEEQRLRIGTRDHLVYATLGLLAMAVAGALQADRVELLLLAPPGCIAMGWTYLVNDDRITAIGGYLVGTLVPRLTGLLDARHPVFEWESVHRGDRWHRTRKNGQLGVDLLIFCAPAAVAVPFALVYGQASAATVTVGVIELLATALLATRFGVHTRAALSRGGTR